jgi:hypothetical protein
MYLLLFSFFSTYPKSLNAHITMGKYGDEAKMSATRDSVKGGQRPPKRSSEEICIGLGFAGIDAFLALMRTLPYPYHIHENDSTVKPDDFAVQAFPEFPANAPSTANRKGARDGLNGRDMPRYVAAYDLTCRHHYEMQDDWFAMVTNPDAPNYFGFRYPPEPLPFTIFERAMLCVAEDEYWQNYEQHGVGTEGDGGVFRHWIVEWRIKLGRYLADVDGPLRAAVWRDNWRDVREALVATNAKEYPERLRGLPPGERHSPQLSVEEGVLVLAERLMVERRITPWEHMRKEAARLDAEGGYNPGAALVMAYQVGNELYRLAQGPWRGYIVERSGKAFQLHFPRT